MRRAVKIAIVLIPIAILVYDAGKGRFWTFRQVHGLNERLLTAAWSGDMAQVRFLLRIGADANTCGPLPGDKQGEADQGGHCDQDTDGVGTPLHWAARTGHDDIIKLLIAFGGDVNASGGHCCCRKDGPLEWAVENGHGSSALVLLNHGATIRDAFQTALDLGHMKIAQLLLDHGADIEQKGCDGYTALHEAALYGNKAAVEFLLSKGANPNARDMCEGTPLHLAASKCSDQIVELLIAKGANVNAKDRSGHTPLDAAAREGRKSIVRLLMENGAISTPWSAAALGYANKLREFLSSGTDVRATGDSDCTLLHWAETGEIAELLIASGADVNARDSSNVTPLHTAVRRERKDVVRILIAYGGDLTATDDWGDTPIDLAYDDEIISFLRKHGGKTGKELDEEAKNQGSEVRDQRAGERR